MRRPSQLEPWSRSSPDDGRTISFSIESWKELHCREQSIADGDIPGNRRPGRESIIGRAIGPDERSRMAVADALLGCTSGVPRQLPFYPEIDQVSKLIDLNFDVMI